MTERPAFLFDLDGTLIDSVYHHVLAWHMALRDVGIELSIWRIHRKIGMSGGLFEQQLLRETGGSISDEARSQLRRLHAEACRGHANCWPTSPSCACRGPSPPAGDWKPPPDRCSVWA